MKLLICTKCSDVFGLRVNKIRSCECGRTKGQYIDDLNAEYSGAHAIPIGFSNHSLVTALRAQKSEGDLPGREPAGRLFDAFVIPDSAKTMVFLRDVEDTDTDVGC